MGERLNCFTLIPNGNRVHEFELGKFYGYVPYKGIKSLDWLYDHSKLKYYDNFNDRDNTYDSFWCLIGYGPEIILTAEEFREFMTIYVQDINNLDWESWSYHYEKPYRIQKHVSNYDVVFNSNYSKVIKWE